MAESLFVEGTTKEERYKSLVPQIRAIVETETDLIANMANISSILHETFGFLWTGFYRVVGDELVLGPFQGPLACCRITKGKGVCGTSWDKEKTIVVPDVDLFPGHIACSSLSRSEIVVPMFKHSEVIGVLDIDSAEKNTFDEIDKKYLEAILELI